MFAKAREIFNKPEYELARILIRTAGCLIDLSQINSEAKLNMLDIEMADMSKAIATSPIMLEKIRTLEAVERSFKISTSNEKYRDLMALLEDAQKHLNSASQNIMSTLPVRELTATVSKRLRSLSVSTPTSPRISTAHNVISNQPSEIEIPDEYVIKATRTKDIAREKKVFTRKRSNSDLARRTSASSQSSDASDLPTI